NPPSPASGACLRSETRPDPGRGRSGRAATLVIDPTRQLDVRTAPTGRGGASRAASRSRETRSTASRMPRSTILIADDDLVVARELETRLRGLGYEIAGIASSGREAVRLAIETRPSLVLMGIVLKGDMDAIEAAVQIRRRCQAPVLYLTARADPQTLERAPATEPFGDIGEPSSGRQPSANGRPVSLEGVADGAAIGLMGDARRTSQPDVTCSADTTGYPHAENERPAATASVLRELTGRRHSAAVALHADIGLAATQAVTLRGMLQLCAESVVRNLGAALARIWTLNMTGDILLLQASAGLSTQVDGQHGKVAVGTHLIGQIAQ